MKNSKIVKVICLIIILAVVFLLAKNFGVFHYLKNRAELEKVIKDMGVLAPAVYIVIYTIVTLSCVSPVPIAIVGGIVFGGLFGVLYTVIGAGIGLSLAFLIARYVARDFIEKKFGKSEIFKKVENGVKNDGWFILAVTRFLPIFPFGLQNYLYGLTSIKFGLYSILSILFILPGTTAFILLGGAVASGDIQKAIKVSIVASLILFFMSIVARVIKKKFENKEV